LRLGVKAHSNKMTGSCSTKKKVPPACNSLTISK
jgi:hypothetical protein